MNPFSLDHIFHRSLFHIQRQVMTPNMLLFRGFASQASSTPDSYSQRAPGAIQRTLRIRSPFPRLSKSAATVLRGICPFAVPPSGGTRTRVRREVCAAVIRGGSGGGMGT